MRHIRRCKPGISVALVCCLAFVGTTHGDDPPAREPNLPDSFKYYGPNGLYRTWNASQRRGRDTWIFWTGGNQKFLRLGTVLAGRQGHSVEYFRMLDSRNRGERFRKFGLINEPNCFTPDKPDEYGLYLDGWKGDPLDYYPDDKEAYGEPSGVVGLRKFKNPNFDRARWDVKKYFDSPGAIEPPYLIGFSCAFCHIAFDPTNPPKDPEKPRWDNLAANIGNQYFREGDLFFGRGRVILGDSNSGPNRGSDPYDTAGVNAKQFLFHYAVTQQPGTSETSRISYDFINNPNTINAVFNLGNRPLFPERGPDGKLRLVNHVLKDGADSVGIEMALLRVWINIGCEGRYWIDSLFDPFTGRKQKPLDIAELRLEVPPERKKELLARYGPDLGKDWAEAYRRNPDLIAYLASYGPSPLAAAPGGKTYLKADAAQLTRGKEVFARKCAECHSSKQPFYTVDTPRKREQFFLDSVKSPEFLAGNTLTDDRRYSVARLGTNMARALATNAVDGDIWAELSSKDYKALPPVGRSRMRYTFNGNRLEAKPEGAAADPKNDLTIDFTPPGGGRGYYRTPSLVSMWATAPYLHNNALGDLCVIDKDGKRQMFPNDGRDVADADGNPLTIDPSVEGRMKMFDDAVEKLLWPAKRRHAIKRVSQDCEILELSGVVRQHLPGVVKDLLFDFVEAEVMQAVDAHIASKNLPAPVAALLRRAVLAAVRAELASLQDKVKAGDLSGVAQALVGLTKDALLAKVAAAAGADHAEALKTALAGLAERVGAEAKELLALATLKVPKDTPVNLYLNLGVSAIPYALKAHLKYRNDRRRLTEALLQLSECPDLVEDRGHTFGAELTDAEKRDLIEFLKTL